MTNQKTYIVNGEQVEDLEIIQTTNGYNITYKKKFNILEVTSKEIIVRLQKQDIRAHPVIYKKEKIIVLFIKNMKQVHKIIDILYLYEIQYEIDYDQKLIVIDIP